MLDTIIDAAAISLQLHNLGFIILGSIIGLVFGALPGVGGNVALALLIPFTFGMEPMSAFLLFAGTMGGVAFGGSIPAILINTPGTTPNACTCFDGYPMARRGEAGKALGISATASGGGAIFGILVLMLAIPIMRQIVLLFGPPEFFWLVLFGLVAVAFTARGNMLKGLLAGGLGILLSLVGYSLVFGRTRFTFGSEYLWDGIELIPFLIGMFAIAELINLGIRGGTITEKMVPATLAGVLDGAKEVGRNFSTFIRGSIIGTTVGIIPGVGGTVANFLSYTSAMQTSKHPELFGTGLPEGIVASESANDAKDGGALLPTVAFGIPGSSEMAVLLGAFILHGLAPGPFLLRDHLDIIVALIMGLLISNIFASTFGLLSAKYISRLTTINVKYLIPVIAVVCFTGPFVIRSNIWDVMTALVFGIVGFTMRRFGFPVICTVIGFILGFLVEKAFMQSLMIAWGSYAVFFTRPVSIILLVLIIGILLYPVIRRLFFRSKE